jgi:hypothetical protein
LEASGGEFAQNRDNAFGVMPGRGSKAGYTRRRVDAPRLDDGTVIFS